MFKKLFLERFTVSASLDWGMPERSEFAFRKREVASDWCKELSRYGYKNIMIKDSWNEYKPMIDKAAKKAIECLLLFFITLFISLAFVVLLLTASSLYYQNH